MEQMTMLARLATLAACLWTVFVGGAFVDAQEQEPAAPSGSAITQDSVMANQAVSEDDKEEKIAEVKRWNAMMSAFLTIIVALFGLLVMISVFRSFRAYKRGVLTAPKAEPTDYSDAWSQYRLKDSDYYLDDADKDRTDDLGDSDDEDMW